MGNVHLNVFFKDLVKTGLRHTFDRFQSFRKIELRSKAEAPFGNVISTQLACEIIYILEEMMMDERKGLERTRSMFIKEIAGKEFYGAHFREPLFRVL